MTRTFIALEMNSGLQRHLDGVIRQVSQILPELRWVDAYGIHLTLAFLGELDDEQLSSAHEAVSEVVQSAQVFRYRLTQLGMFGSPRQPRVIWMGIEEPTGMLQSVHRVLNRALQQRGFEVDSRPFSPHLTLARVKAPLTAEGQQQLQHLLSGQLSSRLASEMYPARSLDVIKSELSRAGARYTVLRQYPLQAK